MCRIGAIKSREPVQPRLALQLMLPQQEGHDNSGFAIVMQDLEGPFAHYKQKPLLSLASTARGVRLANEYMEDQGFVQLAQWVPEVDRRSDLKISAMPRYVFRNYEYPEAMRNATQAEKESLLLNTRLALRRVLGQEGYVYSLWPDVLTLKEIGDPADIATYFNLWEDSGRLQARNIVVQCRQNTNYDIVRYAAHPFFIQGYTLCANGENTFFTRNRNCQKNLHHGYVGFESDSQTLLYSLHYIHHELHWPLPYYKHILTPLPAAEAATRPDGQVLSLLREACANLEINGPNAIIAMLPEGDMITLCDGKKLRPLVVGQANGMIAIASEVCGLNAIMPQRDSRMDIYPNERETVIIDKNLAVRRCKQ